MEEEIYNIIKIYNDNNEVISRYGLRRIYEIYIEEKGLSEYVKNLNFVDIDDVVASFSKERILFNYNGILKHFLNEPLYVTNFELVQSLLHELRHVEHTKIVDQFKKGTYKYTTKDIYIRVHNLLIVDSYVYFDLTATNQLHTSKLFENDTDPDLNEKFRKLYIENHDIFPDERFCEIDSYKFLKYLVCRFERDEIKFKQYIDYLDFNYYVQLISGYETDDNDILVSPVERFIRKFRFEEHRDTLILARKHLERSFPYDKLSIMRLGLKIDSDTYDRIFDYCIYMNNDLEYGNEDKLIERIKKYK